MWDYFRNPLRSIDLKEVRQLCLLPTNKKLQNYEVWDIWPWISWSLVGLRGAQLGRFVSLYNSQGGPSCFFELWQPGRICLSGTWSPAAKCFPDGHATCAEGQPGDWIAFQIQAASVDLLECSCLACVRLSTAKINNNIFNW